MISEKQLTNFMSSMNEQNKSIDSKVIDLKDVTIFNIRKNATGLYFDIKINGDQEKEIDNLCIPSKFYKTNKENNNNNKMIVNKYTIFEYFILYPSAVVSLAIIFAAIFKYVPIIQRFFDFSMLY